MKESLGHFIREKQKETLIGFVSFGLTQKQGACSVDGLINIGERSDPKGGGFLVLSCIMDIPEGAGQRGVIREAFRRLDFTKNTPPGLHSVIRTGVVFQRTVDLAMEELTFSFSQLTGKEDRLLIKHLLPEMSRCGFDLGEVEWLKTVKKADTGLLNTIAELKIRKLFG